jgi:double zinc ribbon protein
MSSDQPQPTESTCPRCAAPGTGRFCTECGAPLRGAPCSACGQPLTPGSKFCHHCGAQAGAANVPASTGATLGNTIPWAVAGIAFLSLFAMLASRGFNSKRGSSVDAPMNALPNPTVDAGGPVASGAPDDGSGAPFAAMAGAAAAGGVRAPDISQLSPADIASRLFDRVMRLNDQGKADSVAFFAPMAVQAYQMVEQEQGHPLDADQRFDVGRIGEVAGALQIARAQADTILQQHPNHLLGLLLAAQAAKLSGNTTALAEYRARFTKAKTSELAKNLPEYTRHKADIDAGV